MKKYILFLLTFCYLIGSNLLYAQSGCGDPVSSNYYCSENPGACPFDFSQGFPVFYLPATFVDDGSCIYDGVDENGDGLYNGSGEQAPDEDGTENNGILDWEDKNTSGS